LPARLRTWNQHQASTVEFAPAAQIAVVKLNKMYGPVELILPSAGRLDFFWRESISTNESRKPDVCLDYFSGFLFAIHFFDQQILPADLSNV
jgi:hypothetical protein